MNEALQVPQVTTLTGVDGDYKLLELPPGIYSLTFELLQTAAWQSKIYKELFSQPLEAESMTDVLACSPPFSSLTLLRP